jgi:hypothetical protein
MDLDAMAYEDAFADPEPLCTGECDEGCESYADCHRCGFLRDEVDGSAVQYCFLGLGPCESCSRREDG